MEQKHKYGFRKHKAVKGLGVALLGTVGILAGSSLVSANETTNSAVVQTNRTVDATISRVNFNDLTVEQKARIKSGNIDEQLSWINPETGNLEWITGFVAVYQPKGDCKLVPPVTGIEIPDKPLVNEHVPNVPVTSENPQKPLTSVPRTNTRIPNNTKKVPLPKTSSVSSITFTVAGLGLLTFGGYLMFKNRKTGKHIAIALFIAGSIGVSSSVLANTSTFLDIVENVTLQLNSRFTHTPETDECWEYVGYYPEIASVPVETPINPNILPSADLTTETQENKGKVTVHYVDQDGNTIADSKELVNAVVSTIYRTKVTVNGVEEVNEQTVQNDLDYNTAALKVNTIEFNGEAYEFVSVEGNETGKVVAGETNVTYVYRKITQPLVTREELDPIQETGKVIVHYVDEAGNKLADSKELVDAVISTTFRTKITTNGVEEIVENKVVSDATYNAVAVKAAVLEFNGETYEFVSVEGNETGKVVAGETNVTYVYRKITQPLVTREELDPIQETGKVTVHYVDEAGNKLADSKELVNAVLSTTFRTKITTDGVEEIVENKVVSDASYNAAAVKAAVLEYNGETYEFVAVEGNETGKVVAGETEVTYVYRKVNQPVVIRRELEPVLETGRVNVHFEDETGKVLSPSKVLVNTIVSLTERTETITDGVSNIVETKRETNASYDATNLRPDRIEFEGALYEFATVTGEQSGKVLPGETNITYIYRKVPNTTEEFTREIKGKVVTRYIDEVTGQEILPESIVKEGVVAIETTTTTKDYTGKVVDTQVTTEPTNLQYDTTADRDLNNSRIATMRVTPLEALNTLTGQISPIVNGGAAAVAETLDVYIPLSNPQLDGRFLSNQYAAERGFDIGTAQLVESSSVTASREPNEPETYHISNVVTQDGVVTPEFEISNGQVYYVQHYVYTKPVAIEENPVPYVFTRVDKAETGTVEEGVTVVTYYYKRVSLSVTPQSDSINIYFSETTLKA